MQKIGDVRGFCSRCGWWGTVDEALPAVDNDGNFGCPQCVSLIHFGAPNKACSGLPYNVRVFIALSVGANLGGLLWLLFGSR